MKKYNKFRFPIALLSSVCLLLAVAEAKPLPSVNVYEEGDFHDISNHWSKSYVTHCYELGLVSGKQGNTYDPNGEVTLSEGIMVAARVHALWTDGTISASKDSTWYGGALDYALEQGITSGFADYNVSASRAELASLLAKALPEVEYTAINTVETLPDVTESHPYYRDILSLYEAGILSGGDAYGTFHPEKSITRGELATILYRLVEVEQRQVISLETPPEPVAEPTMAYSSDAIIWLGEFPLTGVVIIDGEFYLPFSQLTGIGVLNSSPFLSLSYSSYSDSYTISVKKDVYQGEFAVREPTMLAPSWQELGMAEVDTTEVRFSGDFQGTASNCIRIIGDRYPVIAVSALEEHLDSYFDGETLYLLPDYTLSTPPTYEPDLWGDALQGQVSGTVAEKARTIHDFIVNHLTYGYSSGSEEGYQEDLNKHFQEQKGVCQDYSEIFASLCAQAGIVCEMVTGQASGEGHAWNRIYSDGEWHFVDVTWDDPISSTAVLRHTYFMVGPYSMVSSHCWYDDSYPYQEYDPAWEEIDPMNLKSGDEFRKALVAQFNMGEREIYLRGAYGGSAILSAGLLNDFFWQMRGSYDKDTQCYVFIFT